MEGQFAFNIHADLYQDDFGDLAIVLPGEVAYREVGKNRGEGFVSEARRQLEEGKHPFTWREMTTREIEAGHGWVCICRMGYIDGEPDRPAVELEVDKDTLSPQARAYLASVLE